MEDGEGGAVGWPAHGPRPAPPARLPCCRRLPERRLRPEGVAPEDGSNNKKTTWLLLHVFLISVAVLLRLVSFHLTPASFLVLLLTRVRELEDKLLGLRSPLCTKWFLPVVLLKNGQ